MTEAVRTGLQALEGYAVLGLAFAFAFHSRGLRELDTHSQGAGIGFRLLITPGVVALWPVLALRWWRAGHDGSFLGDQETPVSPRRLRTAHALAWKLLAVVVPMLVAAALGWRPIDPSQSGLPESLATAAQSTEWRDGSSPSQPPSPEASPSH